MNWASLRLDSLNPGRETNLLLCFSGIGSATDSKPAARFHTAGDAYLAKSTQAKTSPGHYWTRLLKVVSIAIFMWMYVRLGLST